MVDPEKDSFDVSVDLVPPELLEEYGIERYYAELQRCLQQYMEQHPLLKQVGKFRLPSRLPSSTIALAAGSRCRISSAAATPPRRACSFG